MPNQISSKIVALTFSILAVSFLAAFYVVAWQEPSQTPPGGNVDTPLNTGSIGQSKAGGLILNTGNAANGLIVATGSVGIGTNNPSQKLDVNGNIHAAGDVCIDAAGGKCLSTVSGGGTPVATGLYGYCRAIQNPGGNACQFAAPPAFCSGVSCGCPSGYTLVNTAFFWWTYSGWPEYFWYSCLKN